MTVEEALNKGRKVLAEAGIETAGLDAALILMKAAGLGRTELATRRDMELAAPAVKAYMEMVAERAAFKPVQYILNNCEFMGLDFYVDERVLIPRPDTEILAGKVIARAKSYNRFNQPVHILDIGTGSGALAVAVAYYAKNAKITATDISEEALEISIANAKANLSPGRVRFLAGDLYEALHAEEKYDIIMSNPPYIKETEELPNSVKLYEPHGALFGGADGLDFYRKIIGGAKDFLNPDNGEIFLEIGHDQKEAVRRILLNGGFKDVELFKDLAGIDRVLAACVKK